ncbi:MAG: HipA family kinase [Acidimicrobiales bacterium]
MIDSRTDPVGGIAIEVPVVPSAAGGSGTFLGLGSDGRRWWVKPANNLQGGKVIVTESVVGRAGALLGAPVCDVAVVELPTEIAGWEFRPGARLEPGFAHASLAVDDVQEARVLEYRERDENRRRHAGVLALYDWCWGGDDQWLYCEADDRKLYSHDHGWYLPETGPNWSEATLMAHVDEPHPLTAPSSDLDKTELRQLVATLNAVTRSALADMLRDVPASWPASDTELEALGFFLERRAPAVAGRMRILMDGKL